MKKEKNRKRRKEIRRRTHSLQYRVISFMCALLLICSTVLLDTGYISMASSFDDESVVEEVATDEFDPDVEVQDADGSDVDFQQIDDVEGESIEEAGGMDAGALDFSSEADWSADTFAAGDAVDNTEAEKVTYTKLINNDSVEIKAEVPAGALPEGAELQVNAIEENTDQYADVAGRLNGLAQNQEEELAGFLAYDIYFTDADGQRTEPAEKVNYSVQYAEAFAPQLADAAATSVAAVKIQKNTETNETELVQLNAEADQLAMEVNENRQLQKAGFQSANTAAFAFTWTTKKAQATEPVENQPEQPAEENPEEVIEQPTEETVSTPIGTIQITEDEVNVRTSPSTEAEILDVVYAGDQLPLLETVTAEDGSIWFKVLYGENVGYVRSDVAAVVEEQQENTDNEENNSGENIVSDTQENSTLTFTKRVNDLVEVTATTENGVIPADAELVVNPVEEGTSKYSETETRLNEEVQDGYEIAGFLAYDIYFQNSSGEKIEPVDGTVKVSISYLEAMAPATVSDISVLSADEEDFSEEQNTNIDVMHFVEDQNGEVQDVVNMTEQGQANVEATTDGEIQKAEFNTGSFSVFTITWKRKSGDTEEFSFKKEIHLVRQDDSTYTDLTNSVNATQGMVLETEDTNPVLYMSTITSSGINSGLYQLDENGTTYRFEGAYIATTSRYGGYSLADKNKVTKLMGRKDTTSNSGVMKYQYKGDTTYRDLQNGQTVIFVYSNAALTESAGLYSENGTTLYATSATTVDLTSISDTLDTTSANGIIPLNTRDQTPGWNGSTRGNQYTYKRTVVGSGEDSVEVKALGRNKTTLQLQYSEDGETWMDVGSNPVKFIYTADAAGDVPATINTADTRNLINISMANYQTYQQYSNLKFDGTDWTGSAAVSQGLVKQDLQNGYPVLQNGTSLDQLFNGKWNKTVSGSYVTGLNHLFSYDASTGTYSYDSDQNYAYYNNNSNNTEKNFIVYADKNYKNSSGTHKVGAFMPYASWNDTNDQNKYAFGMTIAFDFLQPKDGKINGQDMIFSFSGDDDVWVFIDNKLVLDLGGVHDMATGSINFATGEVKVNGSSNTTLQRIFGSTRFTDYTSHSLKFFYMERGRGESNCSLRFNLPPRPTNSIEIVKSLANSDKEKYTNAEFEFKAYLEDEEDRNQNPIQYNAIPKGTPYRVKKNDTFTGEVRYVGDNNKFTLKAGESAVFEGIDSGLRFYAEEVGILSDQFDRVDITDWKVTYHDQDGKETGSTDGKGNTTGNTAAGTYLARSEVKTAGNAARVEFKNTCNAKNLRKLLITKKMNGLSTNDKFSFEVYLTGQNGQFIPYDGSYIVVDKNNNKLRDGKATSEGIISAIAQDETVVIDQILSGTEFRVSEVGLDTSKYADPVKTVEEGSCERPGTIADSDGKIILNKDAHVTITNTLKVNLTVNKVWSDTAKHSSIYAGLYKADGTAVSYVELNEANHFTATFNDISSSDQVYELQSVSENAEFTINGVGYSKVTAGSVIVAKADDTDTKYTVSYDTTTSEDGTMITQTITNTKIVAELKLIKVEKGNLTNPLKYAEFALYKANDDYTYEESNLISNSIKTGQDGRVTVENLVPGKYVLKETKAPDGYSLSTVVWQILVNDDRSVVVTFNGTVINTDNDGAFYIENTKIYSLPSSGGSGTYLYTISGVAFITAALLLFINNKRKEGKARA